MKTFKQFLAEALKNKYSYDDIPDLLEFFEDDIIVLDASEFTIELKETSKFFNNAEEFIKLLNSHVDETVMIKQFSGKFKNNILINWNEDTPAKARILYNSEEIVEANRDGTIEKIEDELDEMEKKLNKFDVNIYRSAQYNKVTYFVSHTRETKRMAYIGMFLEGPFKGRPFTMLVASKDLKKNQEVFVSWKHHIDGGEIKFKGFSR